MNLFHRYWNTFQLKVQNMIRYVFKHLLDCCSVFITHNYSHNIVIQILTSTFLLTTTAPEKRVYKWGKADLLCNSTVFRMEVHVRTIYLHVMRGVPWSFEIEICFGLIFQSFLFTLFVKLFARISHGFLLGLEESNFRWVKTEHGNIRQECVHSTPLKVGFDCLSFIFNLRKYRRGIS